MALVRCCPWSDTISGQMLFLAASAVKFSGQALFLPVSHCSWLSLVKEFLNHLLFRGGTYVLNHGTLHGQLFGHIPIYLSICWHPTRDSALCTTPALPKSAIRASPIQLAQLSMHMCTGTSACITSNHTICNSAYWLDLPVLASNRVLLYWVRQQPLSTVGLEHG